MGHRLGKSYKQRRSRQQLRLIQIFTLFRGK